MDKEKDRLIEGKTGCKTDKLTDRWMNRRRNGRTDGWIEICMN
jgi:hypothetical protein